MSWVLFATPVVLIFLAGWLSSVDVSGMLFGSSTYERLRRTHQRSSEGTTPWTVAGFIVLLLVLLQYQSIFRESWLV
ncbi:putative Binding protein [Hibiscus syriacus]|uniref:Binding protein n=1 Tax=Hibiscus syriacus TaxID=106335 RepID=A0A6A2XCV6_HIBSY|nr:putative Binding protein [Hibiscus syriacus]